MKKFFALCAVASMFVACAKESTDSLVEDFLTPEENAGQVAVQFKSNVTASVQTKAQGGVDQWNAKQDLYIYGFQRVSGAVDYRTATPLIDNVLTKSPSDNGSSALSVLNSENDPFYYVGNYVYDFFGYYLDDLSASVQRRTDGVYVDVELTGGEDIMLAKADPAEDVKRARTEGVFTGDDNWKDAYAYSAYAARRGVQPTLVFKHQLVRFTFQITSGSEYSTTGDAEKNLYVTGLTMKARNKATLCVAGNNPGFVDIEEDMEELYLCSKENGELVGLKKYEVPDKSVVVSDGSNILGESLMVIPNDAPESGETDSYSMTLYMEQAGIKLPYPVDVKFSSVTGAPSGQTQFTAGYSYRITIKVYSIEDVEISAELEPWHAGGDLEIDTDDAPEII